MLSCDQLLELYKHWDGRVANQENLFLPISLAGIPAICLGWERINPELIFITGLVSLLIYAYHLLVIRRIGIIQNNIFYLLKKEYMFDMRLITGFELPSKKRSISHRFLRVVVLPILAILWIGLIFVKLSSVPYEVPNYWIVALCFYLVITISLTTLILPVSNSAWTHKEDSSDENA
jgi:hypothetical protein